MEGLTFYGISWAIWIIATFIMNKQSSIRFPLASLVLIGIIVSPYTFSVNEYTINYIGVFILTIIFFIVGTFSLKNKSYFIITSFIISIGYVTFLLFELFDPVWVIFKREWMLSFGLTYLSMLLHKKLSMRIYSVLIGCLYGDVLFTFVLHHFSFPYTIAPFEFLDVVSLTALLIFVWEGIKISIAYFESFYHVEEREKHKTT